MQNGRRGLRHLLISLMYVMTTAEAAPAVRAGFLNQVLSYPFDRGNEGHHLLFPLQNSTQASPLPDII